MDFDFSPYFKKYEALVALAEKAFEKMKQSYPDCVTCEIGCADCCFALFDLTLIEALYLQHQFQKRLPGETQDLIEDKANRIDRQIAKLKRKAVKDLQSGKEEALILEEMARFRVRCPLLNDAEKCDLYDYRPITCRLYGVPTMIAGKAHTCGKTAFQTGTEYPTVNLDVIHAKLQEISAELIRDLETHHVKLVDILIPVSMALLTRFDGVYFGLEAEAVSPSPHGHRKRVRRR
jgi:Fe-S-cluster containining protein